MSACHNEHNGTPRHSSITQIQLVSGLCTPVLYLRPVYTSIDLQCFAVMFTSCGVHAYIVCVCCSQYISSLAGFYMVLSSGRNELYLGYELDQLAIGAVHVMFIVAC